MTIINGTTVVVFSSAELKEALENNNGYTYIYFGSNITLTSGIIISSNRVKLLLMARIMILFMNMLIKRN